MEKERERCTDNGGNQFNEQIKKMVWSTGIKIPNYPVDVWRIDYTGMVIRYDKFGDSEDFYGWEIDHIDPVSNGGGDDIDNLQPLNCKRNIEKGDEVDWVFPE